MSCECECKGKDPDNGCGFFMIILILIIVWGISDVVDSIVTRIDKIDKKIELLKP